MKKKKKRDSEVPSTLPHTSVNREPFGKHLSLIRFLATPSSAFSAGPRIIPTPDSRGDYRFFSTSSTAASLHKPLLPDRGQTTRERLLFLHQVPEISPAVCSSSLPAPKSNRLENALNAVKL